MVPHSMMQTTMVISSLEVLPDYVMTVLLQVLYTTLALTPGHGVVSEQMEVALRCVMLMKIDVVISSSPVGKHVTE